MSYHYLFGQPVRAVSPRATGSRKLFLLGAYPSALHVKWSPPGAFRSIQAVAVADEPESFWTGADETEYIDRWWFDVGFQDIWGTIAPCGHLNGSSGRWVDDRVLRPLGVERSHTWITDCLDTYFESKKAAARLSTSPLVEIVERLGIVSAHHRSHPSEDEIVRGAMSNHMDRLRRELATAQPEEIVTLGNAALRVLLHLLTFEGQPPLDRLSVDPLTYGRVNFCRFEKRPVRWLPLAHPAAPPAYQHAHNLWIQALPSIT